MRRLARPLALLLLLAPAAAGEFVRGGITIVDPWVRATPAGSNVSSAYFEIRSAAGVSDRLVAAKSPVAGAVEIHSWSIEDGVAKMRSKPSMAVPPSQVLVLKPGGDHLMLMNLTRQLKVGDVVELVLVFEKAGEIAVEAKVAPLGAGGSPDAGSSAKTHAH
jgi:copper(I)-binding protein